MQPPSPGSPPVLELASLPQRHPIGDALLHMFGAQAAIRLGTDPVRAPAGSPHREVAVDRPSPPAPCMPSLDALHVGWGGVPLFTEAFLIQVGRSAHERRITEDAAVVVMALLIHHLEGVIV